MIYVNSKYNVSNKLKNSNIIENNARLNTISFQCKRIENLKRHKCLL